MKQRRRTSNDSEVSFSFLDVIACAFGAIVLLVLILPVGERSGEQSGIQLGDYGNLLLLLADRKDMAAALEDQLAADRRRAGDLDSLLSTRKNASDALRDLVAEARADTSGVQRRIATIEAAQAATETALERARIESQPTDYAGIPVDSEYIAFVVDTSGSMRDIWANVVSEVESVLSIYPEVRGFQVISASGDYLRSRGKWINDSVGNRRLAKARLRTWPAYSASSPEQGILTAVRDLYRPDINMAIFVFGDDYQGTRLRQLPRHRAGRRQQAAGGGRRRRPAHPRLRLQVHHAPSTRTKYATLMRELTRRHNGAFLALSN